MWVYFPCRVDVGIAFAVALLHLRRPQSWYAIRYSIALNYQELLRTALPLSVYFSTTMPFRQRQSDFSTKMAKVI